MRQPEMHGAAQAGYGRAQGGAHLVMHDLYELRGGHRPCHGIRHLRPAPRPRPATAGGDALRRPRALPIQETHLVCCARRLQHLRAVAAAPREQLLPQALRDVLGCAGRNTVRRPRQQTTSAKAPLPVTTLSLTFQANTSETARQQLYAVGQRPKCNPVDTVGEQPHGLTPLRAIFDTETATLPSTSFRGVRAMQLHTG